MQPKGEIKYQVFMNVVIYLTFYHRLLLKVLSKMQSHKIHPRNSPWWYFRFRLQWQRTWWPPTNIRNKLCIVWIKSNRYKWTVQTMNKMADPTAKKKIISYIQRLKHELSPFSQPISAGSGLISLLIQTTLTILKGVYCS